MKLLKNADLKTQKLSEDNEECKCKIKEVNEKCKFKDKEVNVKSQKNANLNTQRLLNNANLKTKEAIMYLMTRVIIAKKNEMQVCCVYSVYTLYT